MQMENDEQNIIFDTRELNLHNVLIFLLPETSCGWKDNKESWTTFYIVLYLVLYKNANKSTKASFSGCIRE